MSAKTEYGRLDAALVRVITELPVGHYVRMEMVGAGGRAARMRVPRLV